VERKLSHSSSSLMMETIRMILLLKSLHILQMRWPILLT